MRTLVDSHRQGLRFADAHPATDFLDRIAKLGLLHGMCSFLAIKTHTETFVTKRFNSSGQGQAGLKGKHQSLTQLTGEGDCIHSADCRSVYASVLRYWWNLPRKGDE